MSSQSMQSSGMDRGESRPMADAGLPSTMDSSGDMHDTVPTRFAEVDGISFAYRRFGHPIGTPIVLLQHFMGNLDNYDPAITDALAVRREVILTDNAGVGLSTGEAPETVAEMARDAASVIDALGLDHVDLFGFSMGGYVAQQIAFDRPALVRRLILVGTGPRGGTDMDRLAAGVEDPQTPWKAGDLSGEVRGSTLLRSNCELNREADASPHSIERIADTVERHTLEPAVTGRRLVESEKSTSVSADE